MVKVRLFIIIGPTASGKSEVATLIAPYLNAEIISVDSMKVYRGLDIGTAKPKTTTNVKYHLIDVVEPGESFNVARFVEHCDQTIQQIVERGKQPLLVCGTPLYLKGLLSGIFKGPVAQEELRVKLKTIAQEKGSSFLHEELQKIDPVKAVQIHPNDLRRIIRALEVYHVAKQPLSALQTQFSQRRSEYESIMGGLRRKQTDLRQRIQQRIEKMFQEGLVEETQKLLKLDPPASKQACLPACPVPTGSLPFGRDRQTRLARQVWQAVGYKEVKRYLHGEVSLEEAKELVRRHTWTLARRQMTWFRRFSQINWFDVRPQETTEQIAGRIKAVFFK